VQKLLIAMFACLALAGILMAAAADPAAPADNDAPPAKPKAFTSVETKDLHNAHVVTDKLISGAAPENEQAFKDLQALGVKTIISVDGAKPDAETARRFGMRYVHLPITYSGVKTEEGRQIAKALAELPGPVYVHCHHGKHRSAAAVAVACVLSGSLKPEQAESVLETFGTGANYKGLWKSARDARRMDAGVLADVKVEYVEAAKIPALAERMVEIDKFWETMKALQKNGWRPLPDQPRLDAAHEALQLQEHLRESGRGPDAGGRPPEFHKLLTDGDEGAGHLHKALSAKPVDVAGAEAAFKRVATSCTTCHKAYRD
jgi:protein tyrosine phosphatase (PTP) superfamily phosphohydrolase (DUF442 family)